MTEHTARPPDTPQLWLEAWKAGDPAIAAYYSSGPWEVPNPALEARRPLTPEAVAEWKAFLKPFAGEGDLGPLDSLCQDDALVVVTGQQAGATLGPLYTLYKALAARHWAAEIARRTGRPCLPVFWVASDDHDLAEVRDVHWLDTGENHRSRPLADPSRENRRSVFREKLDPGFVGTFLEEFTTSTRESEFRPALLEALHAALEGGDFESQFLSLSCRYLLPLGIYPIVPRLDFLRRGAVAIFEKELDSPGASSRLVQQRGTDLAATGQPAPLHRKGTELNFFIDEAGVRARVEIVDGAHETHEPGTGRRLGRYTTSELRALLHEDPARFSANALLRPLVQDHVLPTAAYIAGPTEMVYHGQIGPLYKEFAVPRPAVFPRPNVFLLETRHVRALEKLGADRHSLLHGGSLQAAEDHLDQLLAEGAAQTRLEGHLDAMRKEFDALSAHLSGLGRDAATEKALEKLRQSFETGADKLHERLRVYLANRDANLAAARDKLLAGLFPGGTPQERAIGPLAPLLTNHGPRAVNALADAIDYQAPGFQVIELEGVKG